MGLLAGYDIYHFCRIVTPLKPGDYDFFKQYGKLVLDVDDDMTDQHRQFGMGDWLRQTVAEMDAVTVSTHHLAKVMRQYGKPVYVIENHLDTKYYAKTSMEAERKDDRLTIGLIGTRSHFFDWYKVIDALIKIKNKYPDVNIAIGGYHPPYIEKIPDVTKLPFASIAAYPAMLRQFDIRLCPLDIDDQFNWSKSPISALEAMAAAREIPGVGIGGCVPICQDLPLFRRVINNTVNGLLAQDDIWFDAIEHLISNGMLKLIAERCHKWVKKNRDLVNVVPTLARTLKAIARP